MEIPSTEGDGRAGRRDGRKFKSYFPHAIIFNDSLLQMSLFAMFALYNSYLSFWKIILDAPALLPNMTTAYLSLALLYRHTHIYLHIHTHMHRQIMQMPYLYVSRLFCLDCTFRLGQSTAQALDSVTCRS